MGRALSPEQLAPDGPASGATSSKTRRGAPLSILPPPGWGLRAPPGGAHPRAIGEDGDVVACFLLRISVHYLMGSARTLGLDPALLDKPLRAASGRPIRGCPAGDQDCPSSWSPERSFSALAGPPIDSGPITHPSPRRGERLFLGHRQSATRPLGSGPPIFIKIRGVKHYLLSDSRVAVRSYDEI